MLRYQIISAGKVQHEQYMVLDCNYQPIHFFPKKYYQDIKFCFWKISFIIDVLEMGYSVDEILIIWLNWAIRRYI